jgi:hypothetical protein
VVVTATLPPASARLDPRGDDGTVPGVIHVHTNQSDGRSGPDDIAAAARSAGLKFVIFTDHGDATRAPDQPVYRRGVLCLDAVEISTTGGHYLALDMPAAPYPLGGEPRDVVEDVARLGGFGVPAHPDSPKIELRWREWRAPVDGMEIINPDTGWRMRAHEAGWRPKLQLAERLFSYPFRPGETIASFVTVSSENLAQWETLTRRRKVVGLAGADAHSRLALASSEPGDNRYALALPSYEASFRTLSVHVRPERPLTSLPGNAPADARSLMQGIRAGHLYTVVDGLASPPLFEFTATDGAKTVSEGDEIVPGGPLVLSVHSNAPPTFTTTVLQGSHVVQTSGAAQFTVSASDAPAVYRVEIRASDRPNEPPWLISNPIYSRAAAAPPSPPVRAPAAETDRIFVGRGGSTWRVEHDPSSSAVLDVPAAEAGGGLPDVPPAEAGGRLRLRYGLAASRSPHTYAALVAELPGGIGAHTGLAFGARAERPMRISVQLRTGVGGMPEERWQRSVYVDTVERDHAVRFDDLTPVGETRSPGPALSEIRYVLFVIDTTNTKPGANGQVWIERPALRR